MHTPVLSEEVIEALAIKKDGLYIDATVGEGGHLKEIIEHGGKVLAIDWDNQQIKKLKVKNDQYAIFASGNFADIERIAKKEGFSKIDGVLFDLGLSISQIKNSKRGFSYKNLDEPLDMRLNQRTKVTAAELINSLSEEELYEIFAGFSEELNSRAIASAIYRTRHSKKIQTVRELVLTINQVATERREKVYSRIFQALRIAVNREFENLKRGLEGALSLLIPGGRLVVITFHSLEDRIVKNFIQTHDILKPGKKISGKRKRAFAFERSAIVRVGIKL